MVVRCVLVHQILKRQILKRQILKLQILKLQPLYPQLPTLQRPKTLPTQHGAPRCRLAQKMAAQSLGRRCRRRPPRLAILARAILATAIPHVQANVRLAWGLVLPRIGSPA